MAGMPSLPEYAPLQEDAVKSVLLAAFSSIALATAALADPSVSGNWRADLGSGVTMTMSVTPNGNWSSDTLQHSKSVRRLQGTYEQKASSEDHGTIIFKPSQASARNSGAQVETDEYELAQGGRELRLTSEGDTMVFHKR